MTPAAWGFVTVDLPALLACVFLLGLHPTLFGPVKFACLPQHLGKRELTGGNGLIEKGTFVAILLVFRSMFGISWLWFFGAVFLSSFPAFAKDVLHGNEQVASLLLVVFSIGIGSLLCESLSRRHVEIGLVPLGAIGMSVFARLVLRLARPAAT